MNQRVTLGIVFSSGLGSSLSIGALRALGAPISPEIAAGLVVGLWMIVLIILAEP